MFKILSLVETANGLEPDAFRAFWRDRYLAEVLAIPGLAKAILKVVHNHVLPGSIREDSTAPFGWSGVSETWFPDQATAEQFLRSPLVAAIATKHTDTIKTLVQIPVREIKMWDRGGDHKAMKAFAFFHPNPAMSRDQARHYWNTDHVAAGARLGLDRKLSKYVQNHTVDHIISQDPMFDYIGAPELWFNSLSDANSLFADKEKVAELALDERIFSDERQSIMMTVDESVVHDTFI